MVDHPHYKVPRNVKHRSYDWELWLGGGRYIGRMSKSSATPATADARNEMSSATGSTHSTGLRYIRVGSQRKIQNSHWSATATRAVFIPLRRGMKTMPATYRNSPPPATAERNDQPPQQSAQKNDNQDLESTRNGGATKMITFRKWPATAGLTRNLTAEEHPQRRDSRKKYLPIQENFERFCKPRKRSSI